MLALVRLLGIVAAGAGIAILLNPGILKAMMNFWRQGRRIYLAGAIRLVFGTIFILVAPACRFAAVIYTLGLLMIIGAIIVFAIGPQKIYKMFDWWQAKPPVVARLMGLVALVIGALILYSV